MKKNIIFPILTLLLVAVLVYGISGSAAWFSEIVRIENNVITTGNIDMGITEVEKFTPVLEPGGDYMEVLRFCAENQGTYDMKWRGLLTDIKAPAGMTDKILISVIINPTRELTGNYGPVGEVWFMDVPVTELTTPNTHLLLDASTNPLPFKPADRVCYSLLARLDESAQNEYPQAIFSATLQLNAIQWISTSLDWSE